MENIKLETEFKLETIFVSLDKDTLNKLDDILKTREIDKQEIAAVTKYMYLVQQTNKTPNIDTLRKEFPDLYFDDVVKLSGEALDDYIKLFIANRKNSKIAKNLLELASVVRTNGLNEDILNKLNMISKSDTVSIEHEDIAVNIAEVYKKKVTQSGLNTGIKRIDEDTGGLQPGTMTTILGFTGSFKTTWALNIAYNAINNDKNVLYLSLEVTKENIMYNLLSRHSLDDKFKVKIEHLDLKHKKLSKTDEDYLFDKIHPDLLSLKGNIQVVDETELESYSFYALDNKFREIDKLITEKTSHRSRFISNRPCTIIKV